MNGPNLTIPVVTLPVPMLMEEFVVIPPADPS